MDKRAKREARRKIYCTVGIVGGGWVDSPSRTSSPCDSVEVLPDKYYIPESGETVADIYQYPVPILAANQEVTKKCPQIGDGQTGDPVTISASAYVTPVPWSEAGRLESWQIRHLRNLPTVEASAFMNSNAGNMASVMGYFQFTEDQAESFSSAFLEAVSDLNDFAERQADTKLVCVFRSIPMVIRCPGSTITLEDNCIGQAEFELVGDDVVLPEGFRESLISQEDADTRARLAGNASLRCLYQNKFDIELDCCLDIPPSEAGGAYYSLVKIGEAGTVKYLAGELSGESIDELTQIIQVNRRVDIGCRCSVTDPTQLYSGPIVSEDCVDIGGWITSEDEFCSDRVECSCPPDAVPNKLVLPECYVKDFSKKEATDMAKVECADTLVCQWCNDEQTGECEPGGILIDAFVVKAGEVCSFDSKDDANQQAKELADSQTVCGEKCDSDCFCGTFEEATQKWAGGQLIDLAAVRQEEIRDKVTPCGIKPLPWPCTEVAIETRIRSVRGTESVSSREAVLAMREACLAKKKEIASATDYWCDVGGKTCWSIPSSDFSCPEGYECVSDEEAKSSMKQPERGGNGPCGVTKSGESGWSTQYCYKDLADEGGGGDGDGDCEAGTQCLTEAEAKVQMKDPQQVGGPCGEGMADGEKVDKYCYKDGASDGQCGGGCECMHDSIATERFPDGFEMCGMVECTQSEANQEQSNTPYGYCYKAKEGTSSDRSKSSSSSDSSGSKTAIVPSSLSSKGYRAWYTEESNQLWFNSLIRVLVIGDEEASTYYDIDPRFLEGCEPDSILVRALVGEELCHVAGKVVENTILSLRSEKTQYVTVTLSGIRNGYLGVEYDERDSEEYEANVAYLKMALPTR